jgi:hypothetical protein
MYSYVPKICWNVLIQYANTEALIIPQVELVNISNKGVVAQLGKATGRHQTEDAAVPGSNPAPSQSPERGQDI